jgi:hypothetical protein
MQFIDILHDVGDLMVLTLIFQLTASEKRGCARTDGFHG